MSRIFKNLIKHTLIISSGTFVSRILGFLRDIVIARFFGTAYLIEAFMVAFRLPNMFRSLLGEGAVDSVVIPVISGHKKDESFRRVGGNLILFSFTILSIVVFFGIVFAKFIVMIIAPGFLSNPEKFQLTVRITRIIFSYLLFIGLSANLSGILYARGKYFVPSFSPIILNVVVIAGLFFVVGLEELVSVYILSYFVILAGFLQFLWNLIAAKKYFKFKFNFKKAFHDSAIKKMVKLSVPRIWAVAVYHINVFVDTFLASFSFLAGYGAIAAIYYSNRLIQFPLALFSLGISRAALPKLSSLNAEKNTAEFKQTLNFSLKSLSFFILPFSVLFLTLSEPIIEVVFKRGEFDSYSVSITSLAFFFYSLGVFFFSAVRLLISTFYSLKDTKTPAKVATLALGLNVVLSVVLMQFLKVGGLAFASSLSSMIAFFTLLNILQKRLGKLDRGVWIETGKALIASLVMGLGAAYLWAYFKNTDIILRLLFSMIGSGLIFFITAVIIKVELMWRFVIKKLWA